MKKAAITLLVVLIAVSCVTSRWLPTRSQDDRLDKLREMLKDVSKIKWQKKVFGFKKYSCNIFIALF